MLRDDVTCSKRRKLGQVMKHGNGENDNFGVEHFGKQNFPQI